MNWHLFATVFGVMVLGELPDKTAFIVLFLATHHDVWGVFIGAAAAFLVQSVVAVTLGTVLLRLAPPQIVHMVSGAMFLVFAFLMWRKKEEKTAEIKEEVRDIEKAEPAELKRGRFLKAVTTAFGAIFIAEWGDITQLATASFAAKYHQPLLIGVSATLGLWSVTALTVLAGHYAKAAIPQKVFQKIAAMAFAGIGLFLLIRG